MNVEARTHRSSMLARRGVLVKIADLTTAKYRDIISQGAGGLIILLPERLYSLSSQTKQVFALCN